MKTKTRHDVKKFVMTWKTYHDIQNFVKISKTRFHYIVFLKFKKKSQYDKKLVMDFQKYVMPTKRKNTPWRHKVRHYVIKCVKTSNSASCCQKVRCYIWHYDVCYTYSCHSAKTFVTSKMCHSSLHKKVRHDVKMFVMKSKSLSWSQKHVMTWKVKNMSTFCHEVKHISWRHKVRYDIKRFVMVSKSCYDDNKFVIASKNSSWHVMTSKVCEKDKNMSWSQKHFMKSQNALWRDDFNKVVMMSKTYHDVKKFARHGVKNMLWWQKVRLCFKKIIMTRHDVKSLSWSQKFVMKSKVVVK